MAPKSKTATKTAKPSPRSGYALPVGAHPGNTGGKKGRSGAKSKAFLARCAAALEDDELWRAARKKYPLGTLQLASDYTHSKRPQHHKVDATVIFKAVRE